MAKQAGACFCHMTADVGAPWGLGCAAHGAAHQGIARRGGRPSRAAATPRPGCLLHQAEVEELRAALAAKEAELAAAGAELAEADGEVLRRAAWAS